MHKLFIAISLITAASACATEGGPRPEPPILEVTSPRRGTIQSGLADVEVTRWGYAVEYDYVEPTQLASSLETRAIGRMSRSLSYGSFSRW